MGNESTRCTEFWGTSCPPTRFLSIAYLLGAGARPGAGWWALGAPGRGPSSGGPPRRRWRSGGGGTGPLAPLARAPRPPLGLAAPPPPPLPAPRATGTRATAPRRQRRRRRRTRRRCTIPGGGCCCWLVGARTGAALAAPRRPRAGPPYPCGACGDVLREGEGGNGCVWGKWGGGTQFTITHRCLNCGNSAMPWVRERGGVVCGHTTTFWHEHSPSPRRESASRCRRGAGAAPCLVWLVVPVCVCVMLRAGPPTS